METVKIVKIINDCKDAVDRSAFGPLFQYPDKGNVVNKQVNQLAMLVFQTTLPMILGDELTKERDAKNNNSQDNKAI